MLDYESKKKVLIKENMSKVQKEFMNSDFQEKIGRYSEKFGISKHVLEERIVAGDEITISIFAKDPSKQNFYEKTAAEFIENIPGVIDFKNLPNGGANALFIEKDSVRKRSAIVGKTESKSVDFKWTFVKDGIKYFAFHKYIKDNGGAQDNQFNDVLKSIVAARSIGGHARHHVLFICDGDYFTPTKLAILTGAISNTNHKVMDINEVEEYLNEEK